MGKCLSICTSGSDTYDYCYNAQYKAKRKRTHVPDDDMYAPCAKPNTRHNTDDRKYDINHRMSTEDLCNVRGIHSHEKRQGLSRSNSCATVKSAGNISGTTMYSSFHGSAREHVYGHSRHGTQRQNDIYSSSNDSRVYSQTSDYESMKYSTGDRREYHDRRYDVYGNRLQRDADFEEGEEQSWNFYPIYSSQEGEIFYNMENQRRGYCIIFNVKQVGQSVRHGTDVDSNRLDRTFRHLGYDIYVKTNPTKAEMKEVILTYASYDHSREDCFACVVLSHGRDGHIRSTYDEEVSLHEIMDPVKNCRSLLGKPKLFFIQACRGTNTDHGLVTDGVDAVRDDLIISKLSSHIDVLVSYATVQDHVAYRNTRDGSIYIIILTELLLKEGFTTNLTSLLAKVTDLTSKSIPAVFQVPCFTSTLTKLLQFKPKKRMVKTTHHYSDGTTDEIDHDESYIIREFV